MNFQSSLWALALALAILIFESSQPPPVEILSFKIGSDYYPMLDRKSPVETADSPDFPRTPGEAPTRRTKAVRMEEARSHGKLRSQIKVIDQAEWVKVAVKNLSRLPIKTIDWDFAFPRYVDGALLLRYDVTSKIEIKPGGKKELKQPLPFNAKKCQAVVVSEDEQDGKAKTFEAVCGPGFQDPSKLKGQESATIKRIEYADGSVWRRAE